MASSEETASQAHVSILRPNRRKDRNRDANARRYMLWCQELACVACYAGLWRDWLALDGRPHPPDGISEAAHVGGNIAAKANNWCCVPLCTYHHRGNVNSEENLKRRFWNKLGVDGYAVMAKLKEWFVGNHVDYSEESSTENL